MTQPAEWSLGLAAWIIQDGNYGDFHRGQRIEVAVEFAFEDVELVAEGEPSARLLEASFHALTARVLHVESDVWVIDAGVTMFRDAAPPAGVAIGDLVRGSAYVGVDPFFYFERLAHRPS
ncbi:MAG: hypothetical protein ABI175_29030, partial [Polyangiales bacterium]